MFKANLQAKFKRIFGIARVTFNAPNYDKPEQDTLFVEIKDVFSRVTGTNGGKETARVVGAILIFSQTERTTYGFFSKRIENAEYDDTKNFFFEREVEVPDSPVRLQNLVERRVPFTFLYDSQYDPDRGTIDTLETIFTE